MFVLGQVISFYPGAETGWFAFSAVLCMGGLLVRSKAYGVAAVFLVVASIAWSVSGYRRGEQYRVWLAQQPSREERIRQLQEQIKMLDSTNAEPSASANGASPRR
jgi:hypothetical protein